LQCRQDYSVERADTLEGGGVFLFARPPDIFYLHRRPPKLKPNDVLRITSALRLCIFDLACDAESIRSIDAF